MISTAILLAAALIPRTAEQSNDGFRSIFAQDSQITWQTRGQDNASKSYASELLGRAGINYQWTEHIRSCQVLDGKSVQVRSWQLCLDGEDAKLALSLLDRDPYTLASLDCSAHDFPFGTMYFLLDDALLCEFASARSLTLAGGSIVEEVWQAAARTTGISQFSVTLNSGTVALQYLPTLDAEKRIVEVLISWPLDNDTESSLMLRAQKSSLDDGWSTSLYCGLTFTHPYYRESRWRSKTILSD